MTGTSAALAWKSAYWATVTQRPPHTGKEAGKGDSGTPRRNQKPVPSVRNPNFAPASAANFDLRLGRPPRTFALPYEPAQRNPADGKNRFARETARFHLPKFGNLRRHQWLLGLRPTGRGTEAQPPRHLVARH